MKDDIKKLQERFEAEVWLYIDGGLSNEDMLYWNQKLSQYSELNEFYKNIIETIDYYNESNKHQIGNEELNEILSTVFNSKNFFERVSDSISNILEAFFSNNLSTVKAAFVAVVTVIALVILLTTEKPNAVKSISEDILSWHGEVITKQLHDVDESIETLSYEEWEEYRLIQATHDKWEQSFYLLNKEIEKMKQDLGESSL